MDCIEQARVLCSAGVLGVGFDVPTAASAIMARPTLSYSLYLQQGGRVLRPRDSKADALVLDHAGNTERSGLLEDFDPPTELSENDKRTDRRAGHESSGVCFPCCSWQGPGDPGRAADASQGRGGRASGSELVRALVARFERLMDRQELFVDREILPHVEGR